MRQLAEERLVGARLSHYSLQTPLGSGGMGTVYLAYDERLERDVAVKVLAAGLPDEERRRGLLDEARILSRLNHPNIAAVYDVDSDAGRDFLVLEFVPGLTLEERLAGGPLDPAEVTRLGIQMAHGLAAAHAAGVIHCDVKPANIRITPPGDLKLLDFGIATRLLDVPTSLRITTDRTIGGPLGTVPFMSPEQLRGDPVDPRSDVFSAGAVLYQMATGRPPFPQRQLACLIDAVLNRDPVRPRVVSALIARHIEEVILTALEKNPGARQQSASELAEALEAAAAGRSPVLGRLTASARRWRQFLLGERRRIPAGA